MTSDGTYNSRGNEEYVSQSLSFKSANGHVLHPGLHLHRQLLGDGPHTIRSPRHHQLQVVQDHQGETIDFFLSKLLRTIILKDIFSFVYRQNYLPPKKKRLRLMFKILFICQQPIVRLLAQPAIKIELYPVYQSQDNV